MMQVPLMLHRLRRRMQLVRPRSEVVTLTDARTVRASFAECAERIDWLARVLDRLGVEPGDRVATSAWNSQRHFELYFASPCVGAMLHRLNIRLFAEQLVYLVNHAADQVIFVDDDLVGLFEPHVPQLQTGRHCVVIGDDAGGLRNALRYGELLAEAGEGAYDYPEVEERQAAALCYTSGTTGSPRGVRYSHRLIALHSSALLTADVLGLLSRDRVLAVVPMFHASASGLPCGAALAGADIMLPGRHLQADSLAALIEVDLPTLLGCVPTIFANLLRSADEHGADLTSLTNGLCSGSAVRSHRIEAFQERQAMRIFQASRMTETSPVCTVSHPPEGDVQHLVLRASPRRPVPWVELRIVDDAGEEVSAGRQLDGRDRSRPVGRGARLQRFLWRRQVRPRLAARRRHRLHRRAPLRADQRSCQGRDRIGRRVDLLGRAGEPPDGAPGRARGGRDRQARRALGRASARVHCAALIEHLRPRVAKWWLPDEFAFIEAVSKTSVDKFDKKTLPPQLAWRELLTQPTGPPLLRPIHA
jgi:fatty-acyl-CoA synthase